MNIQCFTNLHLPTLCHYWQKQLKLPSLSCRALQCKDYLEEWVYFGKNLKKTYLTWYAVERIAKDGKVTTWLNRYIRNYSKHGLLQFIRFVTGSSNFSPNTHIKLKFVDQTQPHLSPFSNTCFKILILPRQYTSFTHLKDNIDTYLSNEENWVGYTWHVLNRVTCVSMNW